MAIFSLSSAQYIYALFIRDDGEKFVLGVDNYPFSEKQQHFKANTISNDTIELQGVDGVLLAGQVERASTQDFDGYVGDPGMKKLETEQLRRDFFQFFAKNHKFTVVYVLSDQKAIKRQRGFLVDAPEVKEIDQNSPQYHIAMGFEDVNYYSYDEDAAGHEIFANSVDIVRTDEVSGGAEWDTKGLVWDNIGISFEDGSGGELVISVGGISGVYPTISIKGECKDPVIENPTTGDVMMWHGTVAAGQELVIDCNKQTVKISGLSQIANFEGDWLRLAEGQNRIIFTSGGGDNKICRVSFSEVVG